MAAIAVNPVSITGLEVRDVCIDLVVSILPSPFWRESGSPEMRRMIGKCERWLSTHVLVTSPRICFTSASVTLGLTSGGLGIQPLAAQQLAS